MRILGRSNFRNPNYIKDVLDIREPFYNSWYWPNHPLEHVTTVTSTADSISTTGMDIGLNDCLFLTFSMHKSASTPLAVTGGWNMMWTASGSLRYMASYYKYTAPVSDTDMTITYASGSSSVVAALSHFRGISVSNLYQLPSQLFTGTFAGSEVYLESESPTLGYLVASGVGVDSYIDNLSGCTELARIKSGNATYPASLTVSLATLSAGPNGLGYWTDPGLTERAGASMSINPRTRIY